MFSRFFLGLFLGVLVGGAATVFFFSSQGGDYLVAASSRVRRLERALREIDRRQSPLPERLERALLQARKATSRIARLEARRAALDRRLVEPAGQRQPEAASREGAPAPKGRTSAPVKAVPPPVSAKPSPAPPPAPVVGSAASPREPLEAKPAPHRLRIEAVEKVWIHAVIDGGREEKDIILDPGHTVEWSANEGFLITLGNAGGVKINLDGRDLPPLGESGQVVRNLRLPGPAVVPAAARPQESEAE
jgi:cytoskeleton protein RodZ